MAYKGARLFVRWLGAYGHSDSLEASMAFEMSRRASDEVACEGIREESLMRQSKFGLAVRRENVFKTFNGDCWSVRCEDGSLKGSHTNPRHSNHHYVESWAKVGRHGHHAYYGIVIKKNISNDPMYLGDDSFSQKVIALSKLYSLPIYTIKGCKLIKLYG